MFADVVRLAPGTFHTILVKQDGSVWSTGIESDSYYVSGKSESFVPVIMSGAVAAGAGNYYSIVLKGDGSVWTTAKNSKGQLSFLDGSKSSLNTFTIATTIPGAEAVAAGEHHTMVLTNEGHVWAVGSNEYGQLGDDSTSEATRFERVISGKVKAVATGDTHSIVLKEDGSLWGAGQNYHGQLGDGSKDDRHSFIKVLPSGVAAVAAGGYHSMVIKAKDGSVWATGWNEHGQLGDRTGKNRVKYVRVMSSGAKAVAAGRRHSMVLKQDGSVWATGYNKYGQLGDWSTRNRNVFYAVMLDGAIGIGAGGYHSMLIDQDGGIWASGSNEYGQFGGGYGQFGREVTSYEYFFVRISPFDQGSVVRSAWTLCAIVCWYVDWRFVIISHATAEIASTMQASTISKTEEQTMSEGKNQNADST